jgi:LuxR family maltose regulon positive regulatory protein
MRALELARPEAFQRLFLDEGEKMGNLLRTVLPEIRDVALHRYASHLALAFSEPVALPNSLVPASNPLSVQEQRVLHLLATGRTKPAMAQELIVSLNTIKTHVKSIYRKLGATNRQEALARAHALHLL